MSKAKKSDHTFSFQRRLIFMLAFMALCFSFLLARFVWLQVIQHEKYVKLAENNRLTFLPVVPNRGSIYDRNGVLLAHNYSAYTLEITRNKINTDIDDLIEELSRVITIQNKDKRRFKKLLSESKKFEGVPIRTRLTDEEIARFSAQRYRFPGVEIKSYLFRRYPLGSVGAHVIGYIGRINPKERDLIDERGETSEYAGVTHIGKEGVEKSYEKTLLGKTGYEEVEISASGKAVRVLSHKDAVGGQNLILSIDIELQKIVEQAFGKRRGALVAIEPSTGDVLAYVSMPTFDPNLFVEGIDHQTWNELNNSPDYPLLNRPISGAYPPGSTYKPFMSLAALELGYRKTTSAISDPGYYIFGNHRFRDDKPGGHGYVDMYKAIVQSCDTYYYILANDMGVDAIHDFMKPLGFGQKTGIDLEREKKGILPSTEWKRKTYKNPAKQKWIPGETISLGIGQGYNTFTPLQLAHATAIIANNGVVMKPHLVKSVEDPFTKNRTLTVPKESYRLNFKPEHIKFIKNAMIGVTKHGTSARVFAGAKYVSAGKTGTAQVFSLKANEKYNAAMIAERKRDHALYIAFAPADEPKIALAIIVENGGFGATAAAPIAKKAMDYYLLGKEEKETVIEPDLKAQDEDGHSHDGDEEGHEHVTDAIPPEFRVTAPEDKEAENVSDEGKEDADN